MDESEAVIFTITPTASLSAGANAASRVYAGALKTLQRLRDDAAQTLQRQPQVAALVYVVSVTPSMSSAISGKVGNSTVPTKLSQDLLPYPQDGRCLHFSFSL